MINIYAVRRIGLTWQMYADQYGEFYHYVFNKNKQLLHERRGQYVVWPLMPGPWVEMAYMENCKVMLVSEEDRVMAYLFPNSVPVVVQWE